MIRPSEIHWAPCGSHAQGAAPCLRAYKVKGTLCLNEPGISYPHRISYEGEIRHVDWAPNAQCVHCALTLEWTPGGSCCGDQGPRCTLIGSVLDALAIDQLLCYRAPIEVKRLRVGPVLSSSCSWGRRIHTNFHFRAPERTCMSAEDASAEMQTVLVILDRTIARAFAESGEPTAQVPAVAPDHAKT